MNYVDVRISKSALKLIKKIIIHYEQEAPTHKVVDLIQLRKEIEDIQGGTWSQISCPKSYLSKMLNFKVDCETANRTIVSAKKKKSPQNE